MFVSHRYRIPLNGVTGYRLCYRIRQRPSPICPQWRHLLFPRPNQPATLRYLFVRPAGDPQRRRQIIVLHFLPTYSPNTNPIERVWWHLHEEITRNHRCANIEELLNLVFDWLAAGDCFGVETSVYDTARAA
jgi:transposase